MPCEFKVGDIVECIDAPRSFDIEVGRTYVVESIDRSESKITLEGVDGAFYSRRFKILGMSPFTVWETRYVM